MNALPPGEHPHSDRPNFTLEDYLQMCRDGEAEFSLSECARLLGVSRSELYRWMTLASVPNEQFEAVMDKIEASGRKLTTTAVADEIRRRTGRAVEHIETCPHCGGELRRRWR
jgi:DNA-binding phage protein